MVTKKQIKAARKNIKKAQKVWKSMSSIARKKAMPERNYKVHTAKWHKLVKIFRRKGIKNPEALATWKLGKYGYTKIALKKMKKK